MKNQSEAGKSVAGGFFTKRASLRWGFLALALVTVQGGSIPPSVAASKVLEQMGIVQPGLRCEMLGFVFQQFLNAHYSVHQIDDTMKTRVAEQFVKAIDPTKTLLLEADAEKMRKEVPAVFQGFRKGDCSPLQKASELILERAKRDVEVVKGFVMAKNYQIDLNAELNLDPEKRGYSKTLEDREALLKKLVHFQMMNYQLAKVQKAESKKLLVHRYELIQKRVRERQERGELETLFAEAFAVALDPHSSYMSAENLEDFQIQMRLSLEGIGASLTSQDGFTVIEDLIPGGSAERSGTLRPKDKIIAVGQDGQKSEPVIDMDLRDVVRRIRGKKGTKVRLTILRQADKTETFDLELVRDKIDIQEQAAKVGFQERERNGKKFKIAIIDLPSFYGSGEKGGRSSYSDMKAMVKKATDEKADAVVLNLTRNGGGLLEDAVRISGLFIRQGAVVATRTSDGQKDVLEDRDVETQFSGPLVVLTSRLSASASEILAGALKDYKRAVIVGGDHTFGKGTVQVLSGLPLGLGAMKVTTGMFFTPGGKSTQHVGVDSDILVPSAFNRDDVGEKTMDYSLPPQTIENFLGNDANAAERARHWSPVTGDLLKKLMERSKERVSKNPKFAELKKDADEEKANRGVIKLGDLKKRTKTSESQNSTKKERDKKVKDLEQPTIDEGVEIAADWLVQGN